MAKISINISTGSLQPEQFIIGIDLGTTNSLVAFVHPQSKQPVIIKETDHSTMVPSVIYFDENQNPIVGEQAKPFMENEPFRTVYSVKRLLGKSFNDITELAHPFAFTLKETEKDGQVMVQIGQKIFSPVELSSLILNELKARAEHILKANISSCVITVPAYFNDAQRQATRDAGKLAGLDVLRIINEPTAASLAYGFGRKTNENNIIAVYDLGGGTFDVSILRISNGVFEVLSTNGDTFLGGDDLDRELFVFFLKLIGLEEHELKLHQKLWIELKMKSEEAKKHLSYHLEYESSFHGSALRINRKEFEELIRPLVKRTLDCCDRAVTDSGLTKSAIDVIVMVGGSTRIPFIKQEVGRFFNKDVYDEINPDEVVALGAAVQADILAGNNDDLLLLDITPLSLGIETMGGLMDVLIPRNSKVPCQVARQYTTQKDGQTGIQVAVYQGERDLVQHNRKLAAFTLRGIPAMPAGLPKVDVQFIINADGILRVKARELRSGVEQQVEVKPQYGLTDAEVEAMLEASITNARDDMDARALTETITEAEQMLQLTGQFLKKHETFISLVEKQQTEEAMQQLQDAITLNNKSMIRSRIEELNEVTRPYAERVMDAAVAEALRGKQI